jgi:hypothetical protein
MSIQYDEYQREADEALQRALTAKSDEDRACWLRVAQSWLQMIPSDELKKSLDKFDEAVRKIGTGPASKSLH